MATPFDIANFNLTNFADNYNNIFDSTPADVGISVKDSNGNITTKTVANRGKFKQQLWDDVGSALGQFNRTFYVDAENGDDNNDGSSGSPFKTIKKAVDSVPIGGMVVIILAEGEYFVDSNTNTINKYIQILGNTSASDNYIITHDYINSENKYFNSLQLSNTALSLGGITAKTSTQERNSNRYLSSLFGRENSAGVGYIEFYNCKIELNKADLISQSLGGGKLDIFINTNNVIRNDDGAILNIENGSGGASIGGNVSFQDGDVIGIIRDADSGNPLNILSNYNFSS